MFESRFARTSHGISYPNLYRNSAASPRARLTAALASAIDPVITQPTDGDSLKTWETEDGSISLSYRKRIMSLYPLMLRYPRYRSCCIIPVGSKIHTGTFFWDRTTAQSFPRTPTDVILAAVTALKAYSAKVERLSVLSCKYSRSRSESLNHKGASAKGRRKLTDLVQSTLV